MGAYKGLSEKVRDRAYASKRSLGTRIANMFKIFSGISLSPYPNETENVLLLLSFISFPNMIPRAVTIVPRIPPTASVF